MNKADARALAIRHAELARRLAGLEIVIEGSERVPREGAFVLVYNEVRSCRTSRISRSRPVRIDRAVLAAEYTLIPFFKRAAPNWGVVLLRRGHRAEVDRTLRELVAALRAGERASMAPQGRISPDGGVCHFERGAFVIAIRASVPVVPVGVRGGAEILAPGSIELRPGSYGTVSVARSRSLGSPRRTPPRSPSSRAGKWFSSSSPSAR